MESPEGQKKDKDSKVQIKLEVDDTVDQEIVKTPEPNKLNVVKVQSKAFAKTEVSKNESEKQDESDKKQQQEIKDKLDKQSSSVASEDLGLESARKETIEDKKKSKDDEDED